MYSSIHELKQVNPLSHNEPALGVYDSIKVHAPDGKSLQLKTCRDQTVLTSEISERRRKILDGKIEMICFTKFMTKT